MGSYAAILRFPTGFSRLALIAFSAVLGLVGMATPCRAQGAVIGTTTSPDAMNSAAKYYMQYANGNWWATFDDGTQGPVVFSSPDGTTWTSQGRIFTFNPNSAANNWAVRYLGNTIVAGAYRSTSQRYYRSGSLNTNGTVTWNAAEAPVGPVDSTYPALNMNIVNGRPIMWRSDNLAGGSGAFWRGSAIVAPTWTKTATDAPAMSATTIGIYSTGAIYPTGGANADDLIVMRATTSGNAPPGPAPGEHHLVSLKWNASLDAYDASWYNVSTLGGTLTEDTSTEVRTGSDGVYTKKFAAARDSSGNIHVFYVNQNTRLSHYRKAVGFNDSWSRLTADLTGSSISKVGVTALPNNNLLLFYDHNDSRIYYRQYDGTSWGAETILQDLNDPTTDLNDTIAPLENASDCSVGFAFGEGLGPTFNVRFGFATGCPSFQTTQGTGTLMVTDPGSFQMTFDAAFGGGIHTLYDLAEDPGRATDLGGGPDASGVKILHHFGILSGGTFYDPDDNTSDTASPRWVGSPPKLDLLEATPTRVRVRQEAFFQQSGGTTILPLKGTGDYSIYGSGRVALRWTRKTTGSVAFTDQDLNMGVLSECPPLPSCTNLTAYSQNGTIPPGGNLPNPADDFLLLQRSQLGRRTDFLNILYADWALADRVEFDNTVGFATWRDNPVSTSPLTAGTTEVWNLLTYFKPTNFANRTDPAVTARSTEYRTPDTLSIAVGFSWTDPSENTAGTDLFNESEVAYTLQMNPASGLTFDINGGVTPRFKPFFKIRQWRSLAAPNTVNLEGTTLLKDVNYRADVKPVSRAYFKNQVRFYSTLQSAAVFTTPDIGTAGTVNGSPTFGSARYGFGVNIANSTQSVAFSTAGALITPRGAIEFWYQPTYASNDGVLHDICGYVNGGDKFVVEKRADNGLYFQILASGQNSELQITSANYSWRAGDWVHLRLEWDDGVTPIAAQQRLLLNGVDLPHNGPTVDYSSAALSMAALFQFGNTNGDATFAPGIYDEIYVYDGMSNGLIAYAGLTANASEYLADPARNASLAFTAVDSTFTNRGSYLYVGADAKFGGLNIALATAGAGVAAGDIDWQYWNGFSAAWADLEPVGGFGDSSSSFTKKGSVFWASTPPSWSLYSLGGGPELFYVRARLKAGTAYSTFPVESAIKTDILLFQYCGDITAAAQTFVFAPPIPTAVTLQSFTAAAGDQSVELSWTTATELSNMGFHLYRSESAEGPFQRITSSLIAGLGSSPTGRSYSYRDAGLVNGRTYFYMLEDLDTTGQTARHGPVSATPAASSTPPSDDPPGTPPPGSSGGPTYGDPSSVALRELERSPSHVVLELRTGGFTATPEGDGYYRVQVPGFESASRPGEPMLPMRRAFVEAVAGKRVRLATVTASDELRFPGLRPLPEGIPSIEVDDEGSVMPAEKPTREGRAFGEVFPAESARLVGTSFQGETKTSEILLFPVRWDGSGLVLSRRLVVRLNFEGKQADETPLGGSRGRRRIARSSHARGGVVALITVHDRGLYRVDYEDVLPAGGREPRGLSPSSLRLSRQGEAVAYHLSRSVFGPGSSLYFLTEGAALNPYADAVYELEMDQTGLAMEERILAPIAPAETPVGEYLETVRREENYYYQAGLLEAPDLWLWDLAVSPGSSNTTFTTRELSASKTAGRLHVVLQGGSDVPGVVDHHVRVKVNGVAVGETTFDGAREQVLDLVVPGGTFLDGTNTLTLENVGDAGAANSMVFLNWYSVSYPRSLVAVQGKLEGVFESAGAATIEGVSTSSFVLETTGTPQWLTGASASPSGITLPVEASHRYVVTANALRPTVKPLSPSSLRSPAHQADYLLLAPAAFLPAAQPLLAFRQAEGLTTRAVSLEEVYEQFGHGEVSPQAIKEFLEYAYQSWSAPSIRYVLLLGDASYDPKNYLGTGTKDWLPGYPVVTSYIQTVSDPAYASVNGNDSLPDIAIGRLPAASAPEAAALVQKVLDFENGGGSLGGAAVVVADNADLAGRFEADADDIASTVLASRSPQKIYFSIEGSNTRTKIRQAFDSGASLMNYIGHGSTVAWASENFFNYQDVPALGPQPQQPLLLTLNCLNGFFHFPPMNSLSEALLKAQGKGVVAAFSPTGLSVNDPAHVFHKAVLQEVLSGTHARIGDAILAAQDDYAQTGAFPELLSIYHLFGDPALRIR